MFKNYVVKHKTIWLESLIMIGVILLFIVVYTFNMFILFG